MHSNVSGPTKTICSGEVSTIWRVCCKRFLCISISQIEDFKIGHTFGNETDYLSMCGGI